MTGALRGSGRTAALRLAADTAQVLGDVANGVVKPSRLRDLTLRLVQGGGIQKKFAELMLPELQGDHDPPLDIDNVTEEIVRILNVIKTTHFDNLPLGRCGCLQADQEHQCFINFCKGQCVYDEEEEATICEECNAPQGARFLRFAEGLFAFGMEMDGQERARRGCGRSIYSQTTASRAQRG